MQLGKSLVKGYQSYGVDWYKYWYPSYITFSFWDKGWVQDTHSQISLHVDLSGEKPEISLGYDLSFKNGWAINKHLLHEKVAELGERIPKINRLKVSFDDHNQIMDSSDQEAFQDQLRHAQETLSFYFDIAPSELLSEDILENVLSKIEQLRSLVNELKLYASLEEKEKYNRMKEEEKQEGPET